MKLIIALVLTVGLNSCSKVDLYAPSIEPANNEIESVYVAPRKASMSQDSKITLVNPIPRDEAVLRLRIVWPKESENE